MATGQYKKTQVLKIITDEGLTTQRGKPLIAQTFQAILRSRLYAGWVSLPSDKSFDAVRGLHEALVGYEMFGRVQAILDGRKAGSIPKRKINPAFPLKHFIRCDACGTPLTCGFSSGRSKAYGYYWCYNRVCHAAKLRAETLEANFSDLLGQLQADDDLMSRLQGLAAKACDFKHAQISNSRETSGRSHCRAEGQEAEATSLNAGWYSHS